LKLRLHSRRISAVYKQIQMKNALAISENALRADFGQDVPPNVLRALIRPHRTSKAEDARYAATLLYDRCLRYLTKRNLSKEEERSIRRDAATRLHHLAMGCALRCPLLSVMIWGLVTRLCPEQAGRFLLSTVRRAIEVAIYGLGRYGVRHLETQLNWR
jgi:hypothetical protein